MTATLSSLITLPELHNEIQKEGAKYVRHSLRAPPGQALSAKDTAIPGVVSAHYAELDVLAYEKEQLARRVVQLVGRAQARLERDLGRMLHLQGEPPVEPAAPALYYYGASRNPVAQLNESLRSAIALPEAPAWTHAHRWSFASPAAPHDEEYALGDDLVGLAGDGWGSPKVETAWRSGTLLGRAIAARLGG